MSASTGVRCLCTWWVCSPPLVGYLCIRLLKMIAKQGQVWLLRLLLLGGGCTDPHSESDQTLSLYICVRPGGRTEIPWLKTTNKKKTTQRTGKKALPSPLPGSRALLLASAAALCALLAPVRSRELF